MFRYLSTLPPHEFNEMKTLSLPSSITIADWAAKIFKLSTNSQTVDTNAFFPHTFPFDDAKIVTGSVINFVTACIKIHDLQSNEWPFPGQYFFLITSEQENRGVMWVYTNNSCRNSRSLL